MNPRLLTLAALAAFAGQDARADELHVDPVLGQPGASGAEADPLGTVSEALAALASLPGPHTIHLATGTYSATSGESFPWFAGFDLTLAGAGDEAVIDLGAAAGSPGATTMLDAGAAEFCGYEFHVSDLQVVGDTQDDAVLLCKGGKVRIERCSMTGLNAVVPFRGMSDIRRDIALSDSRFESIGTIAFNVGSNTTPGSLHFHRCTIANCGPAAIAQVVYGNGSEAYFHDCLVTGSSSSFSAVGNADEVRRCTIVGNLGPGVSAYHEVEDSILADNLGGDLRSGTRVRDSIVKDGSGIHLGGVIVADPMLMNVAAGDYRPRFGSPAIDVLPPNAATPDLRSQPREIDGDLDVDPRADLGAYEFRPLDLPFGKTERVPLGQPYALEFRGVPGSFFQVLFARDGTVSGTPTPYGSLALPFPGAARIAVGQIGSSGSATLSFPLVGGTALVGTRLGFQSLVRSAQAPAGAALTNGLELIVTL